jgi:hypothetical protein
MVEIALHDEEVDPFLEQMPSGALRIHGSIDADLQNFVENHPQASELQKQEFLKLWTAEEMHREFVREQGLVVISLPTDRH